MRSSVASPARRPAVPPKLVGALPHAAVIALFTLLTAVMLEPLPRLAATHLLDATDPLEWSWVLGFGAHQLLVNPLAIFDANILYPFPNALAYGESSLANILLAAPIVWATGNPVLAQNLLILASFVLAGYGSYLLVADLTGSRAAGIVAGVAFAFCPYRIEKIVHLPFVTAQWLPFILWSLNRHLRAGGRRWAVAFGGFLLLQFLTSFTLAFVATFALAADFLGLAARRRDALRPRLLLPLAAAGLAAGAALFATALPYLEVAQRDGMQRDIAEVVNWSANPGSYLSPNAGSLTWGHVGWLRDRGDWERHALVGLVAGALALVGLGGRAARGQRLGFLLVGLACFVLSLGPAPRHLPFTDLWLPMPYGFLYDHFPGFQSMRVPARFAIGVMLALSGLAGLGAARLIERLGGKNPARRALVAAALAGLVLVEFASFPLAVKPVPTGADVPAVYGWLRSQPDKTALVEYPLNVKGDGQESFTYFAAFHGWRTINGWRSYYPPGYKELTDTMRDFPSPETVQLLANLKVKYVVVHEDWLSPNDLAELRARFAAYGSKRPAGSTDGLALVQRFGSDLVYAVPSTPAAPTVQVGLAADCEARAGESYPARLGYAFVGGEVVGLLDPPARVTVAAEWRATDGAVTRESLTLDGPDAVLARIGRQLPLTAPTRPGVYELSISLVPALSPSQTLAPAKTVVVRPKGTPPSGPLPRLVAARALDAPATADAPLRVETTWTGPCPCECLRSVQVNVFDAGYRVWSAGDRSATPAGDAEARCLSPEVVETREVTLRPDTPAGYYAVEVVALDPATGERRQFVAPDGRTVDRYALEPLRVADAPRAQITRAAPAHPADADLGDAVALAGWTLATPKPRPGDDLGLTLHWKALGVMKADYSVFVHLYGADGKLVAQSDGAPGGGAWPTSRWKLGESVADGYHLKLPADLKPGEYTLAAGLYNPLTLGRLPVVRGADLGDSRLLITRLVIGP